MDNENEIEYAGNDSDGKSVGGMVYQEGYGPQYDQPRSHGNMALASLVMGIIGIVSSCCCCGGIIFGALGIIFALLSRISNRFEGYAMAGLITSIIAVVLSFTVGIGITIFYLLLFPEMGGAF